MKFIVILAILVLALVLVFVFVLNFTFKVQVIFILLVHTLIIRRLKRALIGMRYVLMRAVIRFSIRTFRLDMASAHDGEVKGGQGSEALACCNRR